MKFQLENENLTLFAEKALFWETQGLLMISDVHLGKINHFRRAGIALPSAPNDKNIDRLITLLQKIRPRRVLFMGDLFHSHYNYEWEVLGQVINYFPDISFELVMGNHDILSDYQYEKHQLTVYRKPLRINNFIFSHEPLEMIPENAYNIAGHIHPGVVLKGLGRQRITLPCFYFNHRRAYLPAFGEFTGLYKIKPQTDDHVFVIVEEEVVRV